MCDLQKYSKTSIYHFSASPFNGVASTTIEPVLFQKEQVEIHCLNKSLSTSLHAISFSLIICVHLCTYDSLSIQKAGRQRRQIKNLLKWCSRKHGLGKPYFKIFQNLQEHVQEISSLN